jgi:hypothetical protein
MSAEFNVVLDSGAFSADQQNTSVDVYEYIDYIKENKPDIYFNLDVIGDAKGSWVHQGIMEAEGLHPLPVFHVEDNIRYLHHCIEHYDYFALGGMAGGVSESARQRFLDTCWNIICDITTRLPICKVHGLGLASPLLVARYPWYSIDTASGIHYGRYGIIVIPMMDRKGNPDYTRPPYTIYVTERSTAQKIQGKHIKSVSPDLQEWIYKYIKSRGFTVGKTVVEEVVPDYQLQDNEKFTNRNHTHIERLISKGVFSDGVMRDYFNIDFYMQMEKYLPEWPWPYKPTVRSLF